MNQVLLGSGLQKYIIISSSPSTHLATCFRICIHSGYIWYPMTGEVGLGYLMVKWKINARYPWNFAEILFILFRLLNGNLNGSVNLLPRGLYRLIVLEVLIVRILWIIFMNLNSESMILWNKSLNNYCLSYWNKLPGSGWDLIESGWALLKSGRTILGSGVALL